MREKLSQFCLELIAFALRRLEESPNDPLMVEILNFRSMIFLKREDYLNSFSNAKISFMQIKPPSIQSILRLADASFKTNQFRISLFCYWKLYLSTSIEKIKTHALKTLKSLFRKGFVFLDYCEFDHLDDIEYTTLLTPQEISQYKSQRSNLLISPLQPLDEIHNSSEPRFVVLDHQTEYSYKLPRRFSWVVPLVLAGCSTPRRKEDVEAMKKLGITTIISLTEESPLPETWFKELDVTHHFWPITNYYPPSFSHADKFIQILISQYSNKKGSILVHCGGGIGRAGSLLACYLVRFGLSTPPPLCSTCKIQIPVQCDNYDCAMGSFPALSSDAALALLRSIRPGSIETVHQEKFIVGYASHLFKRLGTRKRIVSRFEEQENAPEGVVRLEGSHKGRPSLVILTGLPGSGKSWFSKQLATQTKKSKATWIIVSQDTLGSRESCENLVSTNLKNLGRDLGLIIDRCNPTPKEREYWISLSGVKKENVIMVHFDSGKDDCIRRCEERFDHQTVRPSSSRSVVESFAKNYIPPSLETDKVQGVYTVTSFNDSKMLLTRFGIIPAKPVDLNKFRKYPRTQHLLNLGSATRDDLIFTESDRQQFLNAPGLLLTIEEKIDGANVGFRLDDNGKIICQNRSHYVNSSSHAQFEMLNSWIFQHRDELKAVLSENVILYGEWMFAKHSIHYDKLSDMFIAFDVYSIIEDKFYSRQKFSQLIGETTIKTVHSLLIPEELVGNGDIKEAEKRLVDMLYEKSVFSESLEREGLVLRLDEVDWLVDKAKIVRPGFIAGDEHWTKGILTRNLIERVED